MGGSVRELLITDDATPPERPTHDVDGIVSISSRGEYYRFADELRGLGLTRTSAREHRCAEGSSLAFASMSCPIIAGILNFTNRWYTDALAHRAPTR